MAEDRTPSGQFERVDVCVDCGGGPSLGGGAFWADGFFVEQSTFAGSDRTPCIRVGDYSKHDKNETRTVLRAMSPETARRLAAELVTFADQMENRDA